MEERFRGEEGYVDWSIMLVEAGLCSCDGCGGHLEDGRCLSCACRHKLQQPASLRQRRTVAWIPVHEAGRCAHRDAVRAQDERERQRQARTRSSAEQLGDPRR